jgi:hypothetical protein
VDTRTPERSPWLRDLPPAVVTEVRRRRGAVLASARGRVLDLDTPGALDLVAAASTPDEIVDDERYDTVISTCRLVVVPDLLGALRALRRLLAVDGELHLIEPVNHPGPVGLVLSSAGSWLPSVAGLHLSRDVVGATRAAGLSAVDVGRFTVPTWVWPLRRFVQVRAVVIEANVHEEESS